MAGLGRKHGMALALALTVVLVLAGLALDRERVGPAVSAEAEVVALRQVSRLRRGQYCDLTVAYDTETLARDHARRSGDPAEALIEPDWTEDRTRRGGDMRARVRSTELREARFLRIATLRVGRQTCKVLRRGERVPVMVGVKPPFRAKPAAELERRRT
ncbi:MAG: hypothetical protein WBF53_10600 [Litorimonas sp.]